MLVSVFLLLPFLGYASNGCCKRRPDFECCCSGSCNIFCCGCVAPNCTCKAECEVTCDTNQWYKCFGCVSKCANKCDAIESTECGSCITQCGGLECCRCYAGANCPTRRLLEGNSNVTFNNYWDTCGVDENAESIYQWDGQISFPINTNYFIAAALGAGYDDIDCILGMFDDLDVDNSSYIEESESSGTHRECENYKKSSASFD